MPKTSTLAIDATNGEFPTLTLADIASKTFTLRVALITPELARTILAKNNTHNRNFRPRAKEDYVRDIRAGNWPLNGEAFKFAYDGTCLDGQHRLAAIVEAGIAVAAVVVTGLDPATQETMDSGRRRTTGDVLALRGETSTACLAAVGRRLLQWDQGDRRFNGRYTPTTAEITALLDVHGHEIRRSVEIATRTYATYRPFQTSVLGVAHHLFSRIAPTDVPEFFARLADGAGLPKNHPILTLRNRGFNDKNTGKRLPEARTMAYLVRTWNAVRAGEELARLVLEENAPVPDPK